MINQSVVQYNLFFLFFFWLGLWLGNKIKLNSVNNRTMIKWNYLKFKVEILIYFVLPFSFNQFIDRSLDCLLYYLIIGVWACVSVPFELPNYFPVIQGKFQFLFYRMFLKKKREFWCKIKNSKTIVPMIFWVIFSFLKSV